MSLAGCGAHCERFISNVFTGTIDSEIMVNFINQIKKATKSVRRKGKQVVIVMDNAPLHKSEMFEENIEQWEKEGIIIYYLPPYGSKLNKIELLWQKIKYEWIPLEAYNQDIKEFRQELDKLLSGIGSLYKIIFA